MNPPGSKSIVQPVTVINNILQGLIFGEEININRLYNECYKNDHDLIITFNEWIQLEDIYIYLLINDNDPLFLDSYQIQKDMLREIIGIIVDKESESKTESDKKLLNIWYTKFKWWRILHLMKCPILNPTSLLQKRHLNNY